MKLKYKKWIDNFLKNNNPQRKCKEATENMNSIFPELRRIWGHVRTMLSDDLQTHWWLEDLDGNIIDPTASQFGVVIEYIPHDESQPEPTGKCPNCGGYCHDYNTVCSDECGMEYVAYINQSRM